MKIEEANRFNHEGGVWALNSIKPSISELVGVILQRLEEYPDAPPTETKMRSWLVGQGYSKHDIDAAIRLIAPRFTGSEPVHRQLGVIRHLSAYESYKLTPAARDALARLELYELIEPQEREVILERLGQFEGEVSVDDLEYLISWIICTSRDVETQQTIYAVFENSQDVLH